MFDFFKKNKVPAGPDIENPGNGHFINVAFSNAERGTWSESVDLVGVLSEILEENNISHKRNEFWIEVKNKLFLRPQIVSLNPLEGSGVRTASTIEVSSVIEPKFSLFEYQHAAGDNTLESIRNGFLGWLKTDFVTILDSLSEDPKECTSMKMGFPDKEVERYIILGPITHSATEISDDNVEHSFCPCCFLTNNYEVFNDQLKDSKVCGIRFFAMRDNEGNIQADCRINGKDYSEGKESLIKYGKTWSGKGFEIRKQYIVLTSRQKPKGT